MKNMAGSLLGCLRASALSLVLAGSAAFPTWAAELGDVVIATQVDLTTLNGSKNVTGWHRWAYRNIYDPLVTLDRSGVVGPALAKSWEQVNETTWRFHLRDDVTFHNGEPFTAEAIRLWISEAKQTDAQARGSMALVREGVVVDDHTIDIVTEGPVAYFIDTIADRLSALPPKYYAEVGAQEFGLKPVGTGAYKFVNWRRGDRIELEANPDYWGGAPVADTLTFWVVPDASARAAAVLSGEALLATQIAPLDAARFEGSAEARIEASKTGNRPIWAGMMSRPVFEDIRVREAVNLAVNRQALVSRLLRGYGKPMGQLCATSMYCHDDAIEPMPYDPVRAKALMDEVNLPAELRSIVLHAPQGPVAQVNELLQVIKANLEAIGFVVELRIDEASQFSKKLYDFDNKNKDLGDIFVYFYQGGPGSETTIRSLTHPDGNWNWQFWYNEEVRGLWDTAIASFDIDVRQDKLQKVSGIVRREMPWLFLYEPLSVWAVSNKIEWTARDDDQIIVQEFVAR